MIRVPSAIRSLLLVLAAGRLSSGAEVLKLDANPQKGFSYPYYLMLPDTIKKPTVLMVEPNNTGAASDDQSFHDTEAYHLIDSKVTWANDLGSPYLVPTFPRPVGLVYTQALDRDTLTTTLMGLVRIDLQLIAMIEDARLQLSARGIAIDKKVWMVGYSASGSFTNRFTMLHPDVIKAASIGSPGSYPIVPLAQWKGKQLRYPAGVADLPNLVNIRFDAATFRNVPLQIYIGDQDLDDALDYPDGYDTEDAALIKQVFGGPPPYLRWPAAEAAYQSIGSLCEFRILRGMTHTWPDWSFIRGFFERNRTEPFPFPRAKPAAYTLYFPHIASSGPWETEIALINTGEIAIQGQLRTFGAEGGAPLQTVALTLPPLGRKEIKVGNFFATPAQIGYISYVSDSGFIAGYSRFQQPGNRVSLAAGTGDKRGWFTKMEKDGWTGIAFVNVDTTAANVLVTVHDENGAEVSRAVFALEPGHKVVCMVDQLFAGDLTRARYFKYTSDVNLLGFTVSGSSDGLMLDGLHSLEKYVKQPK